MQALEVEIHGVLKGHGREGQALVVQAVEKGVKVHLVREAPRRGLFLRRAPPVPPDMT